MLWKWDLATHGIKAAPKTPIPMMPGYPTVSTGAGPELRILVPVIEVPVDLLESAVLKLLVGENVVS